MSKENPTQEGTRLRPETPPLQRRMPPLAFLWTLAFWAASAGAWGGAPDSEDPCAAAEVLLEAGYVDEAKAKYLALLTTEKPPNCAVEGFPGVRSKAIERQAALCAAADALLAAGHADEAKAQYVELLTGDGPTRPDCARTGLSDAAMAKANSAVLRARALAAFGLYDKAFETIEGELEASEKPKVPADLEYLSGGKVPIWRALKREVVPWGRPILEIAALVLALWLLLRFLLPRSPALAIGKFESGGLADTHLGESSSAIIRSHLDRIAAGTLRDDMSLVTGPIEPTPLPAEVEALVPTGPTSWRSPAAWIKAIPALVRWLWPAPILNLAGQLHGRGARGAGITVQLLKGKAVVATHTFWQADFDERSEPADEEVADSLYQLAEYVAVWLVFRMARDLKLLGTGDWRSYALFRAGVLAELQGRTTAAKSLYTRALQLDPKFRGARFNLGMCFRSEKAHETALEQLSRVRDDCEAAGEDGERDLSFYSSIYNLASLEYDLGRIKEAKELAAMLLRRIDGTLHRIADAKGAHDQPALEAQLLAIRPVAGVMLGGLMVELDDEGGRELIREQDRANASSIFPKIRFNLACAYSVMAERDSVPDEREKDLRRSLDHLARSLVLEPSFASRVEGDRSLSFVYREKSDEVQTLIEGQSGTPQKARTAELPLANVDNIGNEHARALNERNIRTSDELLAAALTPAKRRALGQTLNVSEQLVTIWAHTMDLLRVVGLSPPHLKLLVRAGVHSLADLESRSPASLKALFDDLAKTDPQMVAPELAAVEGWVNDARVNTRPKVV